MSSIILETILYDAERHLPGKYDSGLNVVVLVRTSTDFYTLASYQHDRGLWISVLDGKPIYNISHWMYLPKLEAEKYRLVGNPDPIAIDRS